jgi:hypothetical protein
MEGGRDRGVWEAIASSKVVVERGQVLRTHHDCFQRLLIPRAKVQDGRHPARVTVSRIRQLIRGDDQLSLNDEGLTVTFRGDQAAAEALYARLAGEIPELDAPYEPLTQID